MNQWSKEDTEASPLPENRSMDEPVVQGVVREEETLASFLEASRTPEGRTRLASEVSTLLPSLLLSFPSLSSPPQPLLLLPRLRLLRNLLADPSSPHLLPFLRSNGPQIISALLPLPLPFDLLRAALQLLANLSLSLPPHLLPSLWAPLSPSLLLSLSRVRDPRVSAPLSMLLYNSSSSSPQCLRSLSHPVTGLPVLAELLATADAVGYDEEWLEWLLSRICIEEPHFSPLFDLLDPPLRAFLLRILSNTLSSSPDEVAVSDSFTLNVLKVAKEACIDVDFSCGSGSALPTGSHEIDLLGYSLAILRDVCARDDALVIVDLLMSSGLLEFLLTVLRELGPPSIVRKSNASVTADPLKACPYRGFRRDLVSVIANCLHRRKKAQDEIRERNGIFLLMQQCVVDKDNPFLREWGLLAIRNLLEGNEENQREVSELQLQGPVDTPEIAGLGLKVEVEKNGRAKLVNIS